MFLASIASTDASARPRPIERQSSAAPTKVAIILMENHGINTIIGNTTFAPYINSTLWKNGKDWTNYTATGSPSLPNYLSATSGSIDGKHSDDITVGQISVENIFHQLTLAHIRWRSYQEAAPSNCPKNNTSIDSSGGGYALKHDPAMAYGDIGLTKLCQNVIAFKQKAFRSVRRDLATYKPTFVFVTPDLCDDMHGSKQSSTPPDCIAGSQLIIQRGDDWLSNMVPILTGQGYRVFVTWDEPNRVAAMEVGPGVKHVTVTAGRSHYSLCAGIEKLYALSLLQNATKVVAISF